MEHVVGLILWLSPVRLADPDFHLMTKKRYGMVTYVCCGENAHTHTTELLCEVW